MEILNLEDDFEKNIFCIRRQIIMVQVSLGLHHHLGLLDKKINEIGWEYVDNSTPTVVVTRTALPQIVDAPLSRIALDWFDVCLGWWFWISFSFIAFIFRLKSSNDFSISHHKSCYWDRNYEAFKFQKSCGFYNFVIILIIALVFILFYHEKCFCLLKINPIKIDCVEKNWGYYCS